MPAIRTRRIRVGKGILAPVATALWAVLFNRPQVRQSDGLVPWRAGGYSRPMATVMRDRYKRSLLGKANLPIGSPSLRALDFRAHTPIFAHNFHYSAGCDRRILPAKSVCSFSINCSLSPAIVSAFRPIVPKEIRSAADKQMHMIRHDHIATNRNTEVPLGWLDKENECRMNFVASRYDLRPCVQKVMKYSGLVPKTRLKRKGRRSNSCFTLKVVVTAQWTVEFSVLFL